MLAAARPRTGPGAAHWIDWAALVEADKLAAN
jgi:hypothetical protein